jgi:hypothetical protein
MIRSAVLSPSGTIATPRDRGGHQHDEDLGGRIMGTVMWRSRCHADVPSSEAAS